jgi:hypothetical protein
LSATRGAHPRRHGEWVVAPALAGAISLGLSWERWIRPFVDGSRELQVPARVAAGERLYRDVAYYYGPAAPWANAAAVHLFGRRFAVLEAMGVLAAIVLFVALYRLARRAGSPLSAGVAVTAGAAICLGAPNGGAFAFPYAFAALFASAAGIVALAAVAGPSSRIRDALAAASLGFALLAKAEIGAAAAAATLVAGLRSASPREPRRRAVAILLGASLLAAVGYLFAFRGVSWASLATEGPLVLFSPPPEWRQVYRLISGLDDPSGAVSRLATAAFLDLALLGAAWLVARISGPDETRPGLAETVWWILLAAAVVFCATPVGGGVEDRVPPLLAPAPLAAALAALWWLRSPLDEKARARELLFGFAALSSVRVAGNLAYGFVTTPYSILALPALAAAASVLVIDVLAPRLAHPTVFRRVAGAMVLALAAAGLVRLGRIRRAQPVATLSTAAGTLRLPVVWGQASRAVLEDIGSRARPGDTLATFPEAGVFNFATGLRNPLREEQLLPGHLDPAGEARVAEQIRREGPRFLVLVDQTPPGWAAARFGVDYAREIARAIDETYVLSGVARTPGGDPLIRVLERKPG